MPKLSEKSVTMMDGNIVLTQTSKWQARFKIDGRWIRATTKAKELKEAKEAAKDLYMEAHYRKKIGVAARSKPFRDVAKMAIDRMQKALERALGGVVAQIDPAVVKKAREGIDALEHVAHRLGDIVVAREFRPLPSHPINEIIDQRSNVAAVAPLETASPNQ